MMAMPGPQSVLGRPPHPPSTYLLLSTSDEEEIKVLCCAFSPFFRVCFQYSPRFSGNGEYRPFCRGRLGFFVFSGRSSMHAGSCAKERVLTKKMTETQKYHRQRHWLDTVTGPCKQYRLYVWARQRKHVCIICINEIMLTAMNSERRGHAQFFRWWCRGAGASGEHMSWPTTGLIQGPKMSGVSVGNNVFFQSLFSERVGFRYLLLSKARPYEVSSEYSKIWLRRANIKSILKLSICKAAAQISVPA